MVSVDQVSGATAVPNISSTIARVDRLDRSSPARPSVLVCDVNGTATSFLKILCIASVLFSP